MQEEQFHALAIDANNDDGNDNMNGFCHIDTVSTHTFLPYKILLVVIAMGMGMGMGMALSVRANDALVIAQAYKEIRLYGYTRADKTMVLSSEISGKILRINYAIGETIDTKPFFEIDTTFVDFELQSTRLSIAKLQTNKRQVQSKIDFLTKVYNRLKLLNAEGKEPEKNKDAALQKLEQAAFEQIHTQQQQLALEITLNELQERKSRYAIFVPQGWVVTQKLVEVGEYIQGGQRLAKVSDYRRLIVPLAVSGEELAVIEALSSPFTSFVNSKPIATTLKWINPEFNESSRKLNIKLEIVAKLPSSRGGLRIELPLQLKTEGLLIPKDAVSNRYENPRIMVKESGQSVPLLILGESGNHLIVAEDKRLHPGMELVINKTTHNR